MKVIILTVKKENNWNVNYENKSHRSLIVDSQNLPN